MIPNEIPTAVEGSHKIKKKIKKKKKDKKKKKKKKERKEETKPAECRNGKLGELSDFARLHVQANSSSFLST